MRYASALACWLLLAGPATSAAAEPSGGGSVSAYGGRATASAPRPVAVALPLEMERLAQPIVVTDCPGLRIVEWRPSSWFPGVNTARSDDGVRVIVKSCKAAFARYPEFLRSRKLAFTEQSFSVDMALMPANTVADGKDARNLNDLNGRFQVVSPNVTSWGVYDSPLSVLFLRNDPIYKVDGKVVPNKYFVRTFVHELAHVLNDKWGVKARYFPHTPADDEALAEAWVSYLGITFKTESSSEDYSTKLAQ